jgi:hypothetical protein
MTEQATRPADDWWRSAVVYQVYPRSFADADGDGTGDVNGIRARLPYLADLGIDAIWISPWYPSPLLDGGYDVADYRDINPEFGTLADADRRGARARDPDPDRPGPEPLLLGAPVVQGGAGRGQGIAGARPVLVPRW